MKYRKYNLWDPVGGKSYYKWTMDWLDRSLKPDSVLTPKIAKGKGSDPGLLESHLLDGKVIAMGTESGNKKSRQVRTCWM